MANKLKKYSISFFAVTVAPNELFNDPLVGLVGANAGTFPRTAARNGITRELWTIDRVDKPTSQIEGQLRKFRTEDLPEIGRAGEDARPIELLENEGVIEKNFFILYEQTGLLAWHTNGNGSSTNQFAKFLESIWNCKVSIDPLIEADALRRLLRQNVEMKSLEVSLPRPANGEHYPNNDFSEHTLGLLNESEGDRIKIKINIDGRSRQGATRRLSSATKGFVSDMLNMGATSLKAGVVEDGFEHPIDLIADRVQCVQEAEVDSKYPSNDDMFNLLRAAKDECSDAITAYFGEGDSALK